MSNLEEWTEGEKHFARATYPGTPEGVSQAGAEERLLNSNGYVIIDVQGVDGSWDLGGSIARTALGLGLFATTGFGFVAGKRRPGQVVVLYEKRYLSNEEAEANRRANAAQIQLGASIRRRNEVWRQELSALRELETKGAIEQAVTGYMPLFRNTPLNSEAHNQAYQRLLVTLRKLKRYGDEATVASAQVRLLEDASRRGSAVSGVYLARARDRVARASELERRART